MSAKDEAHKGLIRRELETCLIQKSAEASRIASSLPELVKGALATASGSDVGRLQEQMASLKCLMEEAQELTNLLSPPLSVMSETERNQTLRAAEAGWLADGFSPLATMENLRIVQQKTRGRPAKKRHMGLIALDMWHMNPSFSWARVFRQICNCGNQIHGQACSEQLRQQVNDLRSVLRRLGIKEPVRKATH